jgi:hypothetical protein
MCTVEDQARPDGRSERMKRVIMILVAALVGAGTTLAVGHALPRDGQATPPVAAHSAVSPVVASPAFDTPGQEPASGRTVSKEAPEQPATAPAAPCEQEAMLPVIREAIDIVNLGLFWESVDIEECRNGYAHVFAITGGTPPPGTELEGSEQVFLIDVEGHWEMLSSGSGLDCYPGSMPADLKDACEALDLP